MMSKYFYTHKEREVSFKETDNGVCLKGSNSWIHNTDF